MILGPFVGSRWRRAGAILLATFVALRIVLSVELPAEVFLALAMGAAVGVATLLAFGRPDQHPSMAAVAASLGLTGLSVAELAPVEKRTAVARARSSPPSTTAVRSWSRCAAPRNARPISCSACTGTSA